MTLRSCEITGPIIIDFFTCLAGGQRRKQESKGSISGSITRRKDKKEPKKQEEQSDNNIAITTIKLKSLLLDDNGLKAQDFGRMLKLFPELSVTF